MSFLLSMGTPLYASPGKLACCNSSGDPPTHWDRVRILSRSEGKVGKRTTGKGSLFESIALGESQWRDKAEMGRLSRLAAWAAREP